MKLSELLEYTAEQYLDDRTELVAGDADSLWSDEFLIRQFNEAQRRLARDAWCIQTFDEPEVGRIVLRTDKPIYDLHPSILRVKYAIPEDQDWPLGRTNDWRLISPRPFAAAPFDINSQSNSTSGRPLAIATDVATRQLRVFRTPSAAEDGLRLRLNIVRKAISELSVNDLDAEPEVPEDYHYALCTFAAGKALTLPNVDGQAKADGRELLAEFADEVKRARRDRQRAEMEPSTWGFASDTARLDGYGYPA